MVLMKTTDGDQVSDGIVASQGDGYPEANRASSADIRPEHISQECQRRLIGFGTTTEKFGTDGIGSVTPQDRILWTGDPA